MYYYTKCGYTVTEFDLEKAFSITQGKNSVFNVEEYDEFVTSLISSGNIKEDNSNVVDFLKKGNKIFAIRKYLDIFDCTLSEATKEVTRLEEMIKSWNGGK